MNAMRVAGLQFIRPWNQGICFFPPSFKKPYLTNSVKQFDGQVPRCRAIPHLFSVSNWPHESRPAVLVYTAVCLSAELTAFVLGLF